MKVTAATVIDLLSRLRVYFRMTTDARDHGDKEPFRSELYSYRITVFHESGGQESIEKKHLNHTIHGKLNHL